MSPQIERLATVLPAVAVVGGVMYWAITSAYTASQAAQNLAQFHAEVLQRFDKLDSKLDAIPALAARIQELERRMDRVETAKR